jgi:hypothetical protein
MPRKASRASRSRGRKSERSSSLKNLADLRDLFGPPPLWPGEDEAAYRQLDQRIRDYVAPKDVIDEILIADYTELSWEVWRLRQAKAKCIREAARNELASVLERAGHTSWDASSLAHGWDKSVPSAIKEVRRALAQVGFDDQAVAAKALMAIIVEVSTIDDAIAKAELRRNLTLREIARHREVVAFQLREAPLQIENPSAKRDGVEQAENPVANADEPEETE